MTNNDILRRLRYALNLDNAGTTRLFALGGHALSETDLDLLLKKDDEPEELNNNLILRKIRIALELKDADMIRILDAGGMEISKSELSALFRKPGHRNYVHCRDQLLRKFLSGLAAISREELS